MQPLQQMSFDEDRAHKRQRCDIVCSKCTLLNKGTTAKCEACDSTLPAEVEKVPASSVAVADPEKENGKAVYRFLLPEQRVECEHKREVAILQRNEKMEKRNLLANRTEGDIENFQKQNDMIEKRYRQEKVKCIQRKMEKLKTIKANSSIVGTGCECNRVMRVPIVEELLLASSPRMIVEVARIICEYLPSNSTPCEELSDQQRFVINRVLEGHNIFFTGKAGTGKSYVLRKLAGNHMLMKFICTYSFVYSTAGRACLLHSLDRRSGNQSERWNDPS